MNLEQLKRMMVFVSGEEATLVSLSPEQYSDMLHLAQLKHYKRKLGLPEEYQPGMPLPRQAFEITERITEDLRRFKVVMGMNITAPLLVDSAGLANYPVDYYIVTSITYDIPMLGDVLPRKVTILSDLEFEASVTSYVKRPTPMFPVCNMQANKIMFRGISKTMANMTYLRLPNKPYYAVMTDKGYLAYDHDNSRQLEWDDMNLIDIAAIMMSELGISVKSQQLYQYAEKVKERGI